jgi:superfamily II DNA or RNA helicase
MDPTPEDLQQELERLRRENEELKKKLGESVPPAPIAPQPPQQLSIPSADFDHIESAASAVANNSPTDQKVKLFRSLFRSRDDVYAERWESDYSGKKGYSPACENKWDALKNKEPRKYLPLTDQVILDHLSGAKTIGVYPLLKDNRCCFLACDFDGQGWKLDALAYLEVCARYGVPAYLERSRSGDGGHAWIFFSAPVKAETARQLGMRLLRQVMESRAEMDLASYDRVFPSQDFTPRGGFGNLIALPLQKRCRPLGNSEFVDPASPELKSWPDQWAFLSRVKRIAQNELNGILLRVPLISVGLETALTAALPSASQRLPAPEHVRGSIRSMLSIEKSGIPPWLLSRLKHLASIWNPVFFERQRKRFSTYNIPPMIRCYEEDMSHLHLPRGTREEVETLFKEVGARLEIEDLRLTLPPLSLEFHGRLNDDQAHAMQTMLSQDIGALVAPPGAGKTVMGCYAIAQRNVPTLVLSHRKPILEQWRRQLMEFLKLESSQIGQMGGGRDRQTGIVDLGMLQSLEGKPPAELDAFFSRYGFVVIDECHHIPAVTFEASLKRVPARFILGLTATPHRSDGLHDIMPMQCGPIRYRMVAEDSGIPRQLIVRETPMPPLAPELSIQDVFKAMSMEDGRNQFIIEDVLQALSQERRCLILSQRKEHCRLLADGLRQKGKSPFLLSGAVGKKERTAIVKEIKDQPQDTELVIIATGQYLGEGFDCPQVDTLFLVFPVAFRGKLIQYVGRILRKHENKPSVIVYDYLDKQVPVLNAMFFRRVKVYKTMKFLI